MAKLNKEDFISALKEMNLLEIKELVDAMKEEFGVDPSAVAVAAPVAGGAQADAEPSTVTVSISDAGAAKVEEKNKDIHEEICGYLFLYVCFIV